MAAFCVTMAACGSFWACQKRPLGTVVARVGENAGAPEGQPFRVGEMEYGAGMIAAERFGAAKIVDPRPEAMGSIKRTFKKYPHIKNLLPAMGYGKAQTKELESTINGTDCDVVVSGTPIDLERILNVNKPIVRVTYELDEIGKPDLEDVLKDF